MGFPSLVLRQQRRNDLQVRLAKLRLSMKKRAKPVSLYPLRFEDAVRGLLQTPPPPSSKKAKAKRRK